MMVRGGFTSRSGRKLMARFPLRLLGFLLLTVALVIPGCQALVQRDARPVAPATFGSGAGG
jgi:hypothetical protein